MEGLYLKIWQAHGDTPFLDPPLGRQISQELYERTAYLLIKRRVGTSIGRIVLDGTHGCGYELGDGIIIKGETPRILFGHEIPEGLRALCEQIEERARSL